MSLRVWRRVLALAGISTCLLGCGGGGGTSPPAACEIGALYAEDGRAFAAVATSGEVLTYREGVVTWLPPTGDGILVHLDAQGHPRRAVIGGHVLCFANWNATAYTVDIAYVASDGSAFTEHGVPVEAHVLDRLLEALAGLSPASAKRGMPGTGGTWAEAGQEAREVVARSAVIGTVSCAFALATTPLSAGVTAPMAAACAGMFASYGLYLDYEDGEASTAVRSAASTVSLGNTAIGCSGGLAACGWQVVSDVVTGLLVDADATLATLDDALSRAEAALCYEGGQVQVQLWWSSAVDLDLHVKEPNGEEIYFSHPASASGGALDHDDRDGGTASDPAAENVHWKTTAPDGTYEVWAHYYDGGGVTEFELTVWVEGRVALSRSGTLTAVGFGSSHWTFAVGGGAGAFAYTDTFDSPGSWSVDSHIRVTGGALAWDTDADLRSAYDWLRASHASVSPSVGDVIELELTYAGHTDYNTRQKVVFGFTGELPTDDVRPSDFVGGFVTTYRDGVVDQQQTHVLVRAGGTTLLDWGDYANRNVAADYRIRVTVLSTTQFRAQVWRDSTSIYDQVRDGDCLAIAVDRCAVWNARAQSLALQGEYHGTLDSVSWTNP